jgi:ectoine hydroxylase-related dioxygenase (phytanoyl-CoA dioxygenase family)
MREFTDSTEYANRLETLRENAEREGYLFFRGLIDRKSLLDVRREILEIVRDAGWLAPDSELMEGIARLEEKPVEPRPDFMEVYDRIMKLEAFHDLAHDPSMIAMYDRFFGEATLIHPRNIARIIFPQNVKYTTPSHQDYIHIHGTPETYTSWIPLSDCPKSLGGLAVMAGSHRSGIYETHEAYGAGGRGIDTDDLPFEWHASDFELGDVVIFHSHAIHRALPNLSEDRLRLSVDYRYQGASRPVTRASLLPHHARTTWDEIYEGWKSGNRQRYWERLPLNVVEH